MTPTRSLTASVVTLGLASIGAAPLPAFAAAAPCERTANYAAQSGAELLKINRLSVRIPATIQPAPSTAAHPATTDAHPDAASDAGASDDTTTGDTAPTDNATADSPPTSASAAGINNGSREPAAGRSKPATVSAKAGGDTTWTEVGLGEAKTALVTDVKINSAAVVRMLDGKTSSQGALTQPISQLAPPNNDAATKHRTPADRVGPLAIGAGTVHAQARWGGGSDCASVPGEVSRSGADADHIRVLGGLVNVPEKISSVSTTALKRVGSGTQSEAFATVTTGRIELADGRVRIRVLRAPTLLAAMPMDGGGAVRYQPASIEVSGSGIATQRLETLGDSIELTLAPKHAAESTSPSGPGGGLSALDGSAALTGSAAPLPLPTISGLPAVDAPDDESTPAVGPGTRLQISLGDLRQATKGNAIAGRATAIKVAITQQEPATDHSSRPAGYGSQPKAGNKRGHASYGSKTTGPSRGHASYDSKPTAGPSQGHAGYSGKQTTDPSRGHAGLGSKLTTTSVALGFGVLEAAAMAPDPANAAPMPDISGVSLPVTGSQAGLIGAGGLALLLVGGVAVTAGKRRRNAR